MTPMTIALDWDGTVTMDLDGWLGFVRWMNNQGHSVYIVTMRYPSERDPDMAQFSPYIRAVVFTQRGAKKPAMDRLGVPVNVWVDDNPRAVLEDAQAIWGRATPEGQVVTTNEAAGEPVVHVPLGPAAHVQALESALCDLLDGVKRHELEEETGLPTPDCDAIWALYQSVKPA